MPESRKQPIKNHLDKMDREDAYELLVLLVAEYGWLSGRSNEDVVPAVRSACIKEELLSNAALAREAKAMADDD